MRQILALFALSLPAFCAGVPKQATFHKDVLPVLQKRCQECHRPGEAAPMSFVNYKDARPWAKAIKAAVLNKKMPPWFADPAHGQFANDRSLTQQEIDILSAWADGGAKEGNAKDAPSPVTYAEGWTIGKPDAVFEMPQPFTVPAKGTVDYTWIVVPTNFTEDRWVEKIEVRPGARDVVHHVVLMARAPGANYMKNAKPGVPFTPPPGRPMNGEDKGRGIYYMLGGGVEMVSVYVPGGVAYQTKPGQARLIKAGTDLIFQMHYTASGKETKDQSRVGIVFAKEPPKERVVNTFIANPLLRIPAGEANAKVVARVPVHEDVTLQSMFPHMHVRGKSMEYRATYPDGRTEVLLNVPQYDFNWQLSYYLKEPKRLPKGTQLEIVAHYDNSPNNPHNPDPKQEVRWGEQTWEEMLAAFIDFAIPVDVNPGDIARPKTAPKPSGSGGN
ncbi:MAG: thiol-disulfide isomerase [Bryobacterales bacterium]|nr:thiol-disulfide isomerase [Bryobacterales bacterium]